MPAKKSSPKKVFMDGAKNLFEEVKESILAFAGEFFEMQLRSLGSFIANIPRIKEKIRKAITSFVLAFAGFIVLLFGFANYMATTFGWDQGIAQVAVGGAMILIAVLYSKS